MAGIIERLRGFLRGSGSDDAIEKEVAVESVRERLDETRRGVALDPPAGPGTRREVLPDPDPRLDD